MVARQQKMQKNASTQVRNIMMNLIAIKQAIRFSTILYVSDMAI